MMPAVKKGDRGAWDWKDHEPSAWLWLLWYQSSVAWASQLGGMCCLARLGCSYSFSRFTSETSECDASSGQCRVAVGGHKPPTHMTQSPVQHGFFGLRSAG
eukprot:CAMPEP_0202864606 /NCGR_PEP_ID=MMETSP1391-20130828/4777_1 /ASSEMBLY_ACC=CAM_ASM_000867 /TAXON_ID=1034604 /ORGANISM="Chlamydomonas leiostraca, Strain SAG 11-49" /LENGTH=100 /DNA_ID=CAMNT_0049544363 /DNA_START=627 /DNA_END=929 /DNA_ORIENTATION=-